VACLDWHASLNSIVGTEVDPMTTFKKMLTTLAAVPVALALAGPASAAHFSGGGMGGHMGGHMGGMGHMGGHGGMHFAGGPHMGGHAHFAGGYGHFHGDHHRHFGPHFAVGLPFYGYGPDYYYDDDYYDYDVADTGNGVARCEARYHSFDPASGTFLGYDGARHPCPYL
jgi:hypothetical protein